MRWVYGGCGTEYAGAVVKGLGRMVRLLWSWLGLDRLKWVVDWASIGLGKGIVLGLAKRILGLCRLLA